MGRRSSARVTAYERCGDCEVLNGFSYARGTRENIAARISGGGRVAGREALIISPIEEAVRVTVVYSVYAYAGLPSGKSKTDLEEEKCTCQVHVDDCTVDRGTLK